MFSKSAGENSTDIFSEMQVVIFLILAAFEQARPGFPSTNRRLVYYIRVSIHPHPRSLPLFPLAYPELAPSSVSRESNPPSHTSTEHFPPIPTGDTVRHQPPIRLSKSKLSQPYLECMNTQTSPQPNFARRGTRGDRDEGMRW